MLKVKQMSKWCVGSRPAKAGPSKKLRHSSMLRSAKHYLYRLNSQCSSRAGVTTKAGSEMKGAQEPSCRGKIKLADFWAVVPILVLTK